MRLQVVRRLADYNADHPDHQVFVVQYDDFNPFIDRFREGFHGRWRRIDRALGQWRLWDHIDAILSLAVTQLVDRILEVQQARHPAARDEPLPIDKLDANQARDVALLAAIYDQSTAENPADRWQRLRKKLRFSTWKSKWDLAVGSVVTVAALALFLYFGWSNLGALWPWMLVAIAAGWLPWLGRFLKYTWKAWQIGRNTRVLNHSIRPLRKILLNFPAAQLVGQPLPVAQQTDHRYQLLEKLQSVLRSLRLDGIVVIVDRVDEPYLINGSADLMQALVWPMLDNKFLKHPGLGLKLLLPVELERRVDRQERDFHERARLDKQNLIRSLAWTGQSLYDLANARLKACAARRQGADDHRPARSGDRRPPLEGRAGDAARAAAPVQVHVPALHDALQRPQRRQSRLADRSGRIRVGAGPVPARPGRLRSRRGGGLGPVRRIGVIHRHGGLHKHPAAFWGACRNS